MRTLLAFAALAALAACQKPQPGNGAANVAVAASVPASTGKLDRSHAGQAAPATKFEDPDGETVTLAQFEGKPLLLNFWATWCAPCRKELPTLDKLAAAEGDKLQVVTLSQDQGGRAKVDDFFRQAHFQKLDGYLDPTLEVSGALKLNDLPTTILFDAKGREIWRVRGDMDWQGAEARALIAEALR